MSEFPGIPAEIWDSLIPLDADASEPEPDKEDNPPPVETSTTEEFMRKPTPASQAAAIEAYRQAYAHYQHPTYKYQFAQQTQQPQTVARQAITNAAQQASGGGSLDTSDVATLNDALGSAGVDLKAEEQGLQRSLDSEGFRFIADRSKKQPDYPYFDENFLGSTMRTIASHHKITGAAGVPEDCVNYLALALRARLQDLVTAMIDAARHRSRSQFDRPVSLYEDGSASWGIIVRGDVVKQLVALETVEREEEARERRVRQKREQAIDDAVTAVLAGEEHTLEIPADEDMDVDGGARKRRKKEASKSEDVERKTADAVANHAAGITRKYAWLKTGLPSRPKTALPADTALRENPGKARPYRATKLASMTASDPKSDPRMPITIRDAMFVVEKERGHGGGRGAARGWT